MSACLRKASQPPPVYKDAPEPGELRPVLACTLCRPLATFASEENQRAEQLYRKPATVPGLRVVSECCLNNQPLVFRPLYSERALPHSVKDFWLADSNLALGEKPECAVGNFQNGGKHAHVQ